MKLCSPSSLYLLHCSESLLVATSVISVMSLIQTWTQSAGLICAQSQDSNSVLMYEQDRKYQNEEDCGYSTTVTPV